MLASILSQLDEAGWIELPGFLTTAQTQSLQQLAENHLQQGHFRQANIGANTRRTSNPAIRGDQICWLEQETSDANTVYAEFCGFLEALRLQLNETLYLGLFEIELHFALYPPGGRYQKHIDNFQGRSPRVLTFILYLNQDWQPEHGGQLRLYTGENGNNEANANVTGDQQQYVDIAPQAGTLVLFLSERFYHEVLPASRERLSLTGWLLRREV